MDENYVDENYPWIVILLAAAFAVLYTLHASNKKPPGQLVFGRDIIVPIEHVSNWRLIYQHKQIITSK